MLPPWWPNNRPRNGPLITSQGWVNSPSPELRHGFDELAESCGNVSIEAAHTQGPGGIGGFPPGIARPYVRISQFVHRQVRGGHRP